MQIVRSGHHVLPAGLEEHGYLQGVHRRVTRRNEKVCIMHMDTSNCFRSLRLPEVAVGCFRIAVNAFRSLPFAWKLSPIIYLETPQSFVAEAGIIVVLLLHYFDEFLVIGVGKEKTTNETRLLVKYLQ